MRFPRKDSLQRDTGREARGGRLPQRTTRLAGAADHGMRFPPKDSLQRGTGREARGGRLPQRMTRLVGAADCGMRFPPKDFMQLSNGIRIRSVGAIEIWSPNVAADYRAETATQACPGSPRPARVGARRSARNGPPDRPGADRMIPAAMPCNLRTGWPQRFGGQRKAAEGASLF